ncbi:ABC transporter ATP-binding protein [Catenovulum agarivorans]|uniref:ABC transporter ATP-binding protein n=1 Tax=Catenovulum agarivorans TaxID=1172192 RepID=UPI00036ED5FB|nr:ABC transporter ATP-binding protein [Catenovulum agarivorans]
MTKLTLKNISKTYALGENSTIKNIDLEITSGELIVFIGPSGCGKTTLLRLIAGLEPLSDGELWFGQTLMNQVIPSERKIGMVFQNYALYPQMTVFENLSFGLKQKGINKKLIANRVNKVANKLEIAHILQQKPASLSGGQQQRVAIGRCIVQRPQLFLLDEPLSNLDADLRSKTRKEIKQLHQSLGTTMIYVTHDQQEAMTLGDRIAVFAPLSLATDSNLQQVGTPLELYNQPCNRFVAQFLGQPKINMLAASVTAISSENISIRLTASEQLITLAVCSVKEQQEVELAFRPEHVQLSLESSAKSYCTLEAELTSYEQLGSECILYFDYAGTQIISKVQKQFDAEALTPATWLLYIETRHCHIFDKASGSRCN